MIHGFGSYKARKKLVSGTEGRMQKLLLRKESALTKVDHLFSTFSNGGHVAKAGAEQVLIEHGDTEREREREREKEREKERETRRTP